MKRHFPLASSALMLVACILFLWMFFAAATLERTADLGGISAPPGREVRLLAYEYAARWRHGMAGNSPLYMPGFFAVGTVVDEHRYARIADRREIIDGNLAKYAADVVELVKRFIAHSTLVPLFAAFLDHPIVGRLP